MSQRHPVGIAEQFVMADGLNRLRFAGAEELLSIGVGVIDETGRGRLSGARFMLAVQATRATHIYEGVIALCRIGRGVPASMLNRALLEEALHIHWVAANPDEAPALADEHEEFIRLSERDMEHRFDRPTTPLTGEERARLKALRTEFGGYGGSWTKSEHADRVALVKEAWDEEAARDLDYTYSAIQQQNNVLLHSTPSGYGLTMTEERRQLNVSGPDPRWRDALAHGVLGYYLLLRIVAWFFEIDREPTEMCFYQETCYLKDIPEGELAGLPPTATCPCDSGRPISECHGLGPGHGRDDG